VNGEGKTGAEACELLKGTVSSDKHELLFARFNINYNKEPLQARKGTLILRKPCKASEVTELGQTRDDGSSQLTRNKTSNKMLLSASHDDIIGNQFWHETGDERLEHD